MRKLKASGEISPGMVNQIVLLLVPFFVVSSLVTLSDAQIAQFKHFTLRDGLASDAIMSLCQDSNGYLWIGTSDGLNVYDGSTFRSLTVLDGLASSMVNCLCEDRTDPGTVWVGTNGGGVSRCSKSGIVSFTIGKSGWSNRVNWITQSEDGTVYCSTDDGIYEIKRGVTALVVELFKGLAINKLECRGDSLVFVDPIGRLVSYNLTRAKIHTLFSSAHGVNEFSFDADDHLWISTLDGRLINLSSGTIVPGRFWKDVTFIADDKLGNILVGTLHGLYKLNKRRALTGEVLHLTTSNGLPSDELYAGLSDEEGELWIGTGTRGLSELSSLSTFTLPLVSLIYAIDNSEAVSDEGGNVWIAEDNGLLKLSFGKFGMLMKQHFPFSLWGISSSPVGIRITGGNKIWIAFHDGVIRSFHVERQEGNSSSLMLLRSYSVSSFRRSVEILSFIVDRKERIWCSCAGIGVIEFETRVGSSNAGSWIKSPRVFDVKSGLPDNSIRAMLGDSKGNFWFGGYIDGLAKFSFDSGGRSFVSQFTKSNGLADNSVRSISEDSIGNIWVGTRYGGITIIRDTVIRTISVKDGLSSGAVWSMSIREGKRMFFGTQLGLQELENVSEAGMFWNSFGESFPVYSCGLSSTNLLWACGNGNVLVSNLNEGQRKPVPPHVLITGFEVNGVERPFDSLGTLSYHDNTVSIGFSGVSLREGKELKYQYRLDGADDNWHSVHGKPRLTYSGLRPGKYSFEVKATNSSGLQSRAEISFVIVPPYWLKWWFDLLVAIAVVLVVFLAIRTKVRRLLEIERVRSSIATDLHDDIGSGLSRIAILADVALSQAGAPSTKATNSPAEAATDDADAFSLAHLILRIGENSRELVDSMSDVVWSIDPKNVAVTELLSRIRSFAQEICDGMGIALIFKADDALKALRLDARVMRTLLLIAKEGVNNAVKHGRCRTILVELQALKKEIQLRIEDDGTGFIGTGSPSGHGLQNMRSRSEKQGGTFTILSAPGKGTSIEVRIPIQA